MGQGPLDFDDRVRAQMAIERVYEGHRIWPKENGGGRPAPDLDRLRRAATKRVQDYMGKVDALDLIWKHPLTSAQVQGELDRMARQTHSPAVLKELFEALGNDPTAIAECLVKPILADRLVREAYASDVTLNTAARSRAEAAWRTASPDGFSSSGQGTMMRMTLTVGPGAETAGRWPFERDPTSRKVSREELLRMKKRLPRAGEISRLEETEQYFIIRHTVSEDERSVTFETMLFAKEPFDAWWNTRREALTGTYSSPAATYRLPEISAAQASCGGTWSPTFDLEGREAPSVVWTGTEMIVWGGITYQEDVMESHTGARYNPATDSWLPISTGSNCPSPRYAHTAVWTGREMIVWGGLKDQRFPTLVFNTGGRYDPVSDSWQATSTAGECPDARDYHTAVWTGREMIVWGGEDRTAGVESKRTGACYNPDRDAWRRVSSAGGLLGRKNHSAVWTGTEMIVWGGLGWNPETGHGYFKLNDGGRYNPVSDTWTPTSTGDHCPSPRWVHTAVWTGSTMVVWGGDAFDRSADGVANSGGRYDPTTDTWLPTSQGDGCPDAREWHLAAWTGSLMVVWGGFIPDTSFGIFPNTGGRYDPVADTWSPTSLGANVPLGSATSTCVWTGRELIVWGGDGPEGPKRTGARYDPVKDEWTPTSTASMLKGAAFHTAVWTGAEMIVWGGEVWDYLVCTNAGARYDPATDSWTPTSMGAGCPSVREFHVAVWTGSRMFVWGGYNAYTQSEGMATGGLYDPVEDSWTPTSLLGSFPSARRWPTAVWSGSEVIVWGGVGYDSKGNLSMLNSGGRLNPAANTWTPTSTGRYCPAARDGHVAVWTGSSMVVWGGGDDTIGFYQTGGRYDPLRDSWVTSSTGPGCPSARVAATQVVWTGREMIVWGGQTANGLTNTGGRYDPATDVWAPTSTGSGCPSARYNHLLAWTGNQMILWGGTDDVDHFDDGGLYDPGSDSWLPLSTAGGAPLSRLWASSVWSGRQMIVWGGYGPWWRLTSGGLYAPAGGPSFVPLCSVSDLQPCQPGIEVRWPTDPVGDWNDSGDTGGRAYRVARDGVPLAAGGCSGALPYGTASCLDDSAPGAGFYRYSVLYVNACGGFTSATSVPVWDAAFPAPAGEPSPPDGGLAQSPVTLAWAPSAGAESYEVFFGNDAQPQLVGTTSLTSFTLPPQSPGASGRWQVVPVNGCGTARDCPTWSFTTLAPPSVSSVTKMASPYRLKIRGAGFQAGAVVLINGTPVPSTTVRNSGEVLAGSGKPLKALLPKGVQATLTVRNPDGGTSNGFAYIP